jgi:tetratricopeptide (TPR) repeat protein
VRTANHEKAIHDYEEALKLFQKKDYAKAITAFESVVRDYPTEREVADRARMRMKFAREQMSPAGSSKHNSSNDYYLGVIAANDGRLAEAAELLERASRGDAADRAHYALAAVCSLQGDKAGAVAHMQRAVSMSPANRTLALNDPDFDSLRDDPDFMSLLGKLPEGGA